MDRQPRGRIGSKAGGGRGEPSYNILEFCVLFFVFFPYLRIVDIGSDNQPWAMLSSILLLCVYGIYKVRRELASLVLVVLLAIALFFLGPFSLDAVRSLYSYISFFVITVCAFELFKRSGGLSVRFLYFVIAAWFLVGFVQTFVNDTFLTSLLTRTAGGTGRGIVGLAPEPTFYGIVCIFFLLIVMQMDCKKTLLILLLLVQIIFFSKSSMCLLFLVFLAGLMLLSRFSVKQFILTLVALGGGYFIIVTFMANSRIYALLMLVISTPESILVKDASIADRFYAIYYALQGAFENILVPHGFGSFEQYLNVAAVGNDTVSRTNRIMSGYGAPLFELGIIGVLIPIAITRAINYRFSEDRQNRFVYGVFINTIMFSAIPLSFPYIGCLVGLLLFEGDMRRRAIT